MQIVTTVSKNYLPLFDAWLALSRPAAGPGITVYGMDPQSVARQKAQALPTGVELVPGYEDGRTESDYTFNWKNRLGFWRERFDLLSRSLAAGDIVHSDIDAFWVRDLRRRIETIDADLVFSWEAGFPQEIFKLWGFILCCGLFAARDTPASAAFFQAWRSWVERLGDDQRAVNYMLRDLDIRWETGPDLPRDLKARGRIEIAGHGVHIAPGVVSGG